MHLVFINIIGSLRKTEALFHGVIDEITRLYLHNFFLNIANGDFLSVLLFSGDMGIGYYYYKYK